MVVSVVSESRDPDQPHHFISNVWCEYGKLVAPTQTRASPEHVRPASPGSVCDRICDPVTA